MPLQNSIKIIDNAFTTGSFDLLPNAMFRVELENGAKVTSWIHLAAQGCQKGARGTPGHPKITKILTRQMQLKLFGGH